MSIHPEFVPTAGAEDPPCVSCGGPRLDWDLAHEHLPDCHLGAAIASTHTEDLRTLGRCLSFRRRLTAAERTQLAGTGRDLTSSWIHVSRHPAGHPQKRIGRNARTRSRRTP